MQRKLTIIWAMLLAAMLLMAGCGKSADPVGDEGGIPESTPAVQPTEPVELELAEEVLTYAGTRVALPGGMGEILDIDHVGDTLWVLGEGTGDTRLIAAVTHEGEALETITYQIEDEFYPGAVSLDGDGTIWLLEGYSTRLENMEEVNRFRLRSIDREGQVTGELDLTAILGEYHYVTDFLAGGDGTVYVLSFPTVGAGGTQTDLTAIGPGGQVIGTVTTGDGRPTLMETEAGLMAAIGTSAGTTTALADFQSGTWRGTVEYDTYFINIALDAAGNLYGDDMHRLCRMDPDTGAATELLYWVDCDILSSGVRGLAVLEDGGILAQVWEDTGMSLLLLRQTRQEAELLTLATLETNYALQRAVIAFNRGQTDYRVRLVDYSVYDTIDEDGVGLTRLHTEIITGQVPDLICTAGLPVERYVANGLLRDLYPLVDGSPDLRREDFVPGLLELLEIDGGLYEMGLSFRLVSALGVAEYLPDPADWTLQYLAETAAETGADLVNRYTTREEFFALVMGLYGDRWLDWAAGTCNFADDDFLLALELARDLPASFDWSPLGQDVPALEDSAARMRRGDQLMELWTIDSLYSLDTVGFSGSADTGDFVHMGLPTADGAAYGAHIELSLGISAVTDHADGAWAFITYLLTDYLEGDGWFMGMPMLSDALDTGLRRALENHGEVTYMVGEETVNVTYTEADVARLYGMIDQITCVLRTDHDLLNIIMEEAAYYFAGDKTAEEVAAIIQNRTQTYVYEQK